MEDDPEEEPNSPDKEGRVDRVNAVLQLGTIAASGLVIYEVMQSNPNERLLSAAVVAALYMFFQEDIRRHPGHVTLRDIFKGNNNEPD